MRNLLLVLAVLSCVPTTLSAQSLSDQCDYCVHNVSVIAPDEHQPLKVAQDVYIRQDKIVRVTRASQRQPKAIHVVDGSGKFLIAGLADMHVHLPAEHPEKFLRMNLLAGVTTLRSMRGKYPHLAIRHQIERGELLGPDLYLSTPPFPYSKIKQEDLSDSLASYKREGFDFVKVLAVKDSGYYEALMTAANKIGFPVVGHWPWQVALTRVIETGYKCVEHLQGLYDAYEQDSASILRLMASMKKHHIWNCPSLDFYNIYWGQVPLADLEQRTGLEFIDSAERADWTKEINDIDARLHAGSGDSVVRKQHDRQEYMVRKYQLVKKLYDAGAPMVISGADADDAFGVPGFCLWEEMKLYASIGIPNAAILRMATSDAATLFGDADKWGRIKAGQRANLVLLSKNPLESIANLSSREAIFIGGKYHSRSELEALVKG